MKYIRQTNCFCKNYKDIEDFNPLERAKATTYWMKGYCVDNGVSRECDCHKVWRLSERYNKLSTDLGLPNYEELSKLKYLGTGDSYKKLKALPEIIQAHNLKNVLTFCSGEDGCQKTTSLAKLVYNLITTSYSVGYINFAELIEKIVAKDPYVDELADMDWLIVEDCFEGETINFRTAYTSFYNMVLKRKMPTIISTSKTREELFENKQSPSYNYDMLSRIFSKVDKYKTSIIFNDHVDKILEVGTGDKVIDIWSM